MKAPLDCGIEIVRGTEGYLCGRMGTEVCKDCGHLFVIFMRKPASSACKSSAIAVAISMLRNRTVSNWSPSGPSYLSLDPPSSGGSG